jgi:hypothetical protein
MDMVIMSTNGPTHVYWGTITVESARSGDLDVIEARRSTAGETRN